MARRPAPKAYDRAYFDRWYRDPRHALIDREHLERRVHLAVSVAEYLIERPIRRVLDVGCGEAPWRAILGRLRPRAHYAGIDPSAYVVERFGRARNLALGGFGEIGTAKVARALRALGARPPYDLIVCSDVLHYVPTKDLAPGLRAIAKSLADGVAFLEFFTADDDTEGDSEGFVPRRAAVYARHLRAAGLEHLGMHCYARRDAGREIMAFERGWATPPRGTRSRGA